MFLGIQPCLSLYMTHYTSGVILKCGYEQSYIVPIINGICMVDNLIDLKFNGKILDDILNKKLLGIHYKLPNRMVTNIKENLCYVGTHNHFFSEYKLPDGRRIKLNNGVTSFEYQYQTNIQPMIKKCIVKLRKNRIINGTKLLHNFCLCGGTTLLNGFSNRIKYENNGQINMFVDKRRQFSSWIGGNIMSNLSHYKNLCITKQEYNDYGSRVLFQKFPNQNELYTQNSPGNALFHPKNVDVNHNDKFDASMQRQLLTDLKLNDEETTHNEATYIESSKEVTPTPAYDKITHPETSKHENSEEPTETEQDYSLSILSGVNTNKRRSNSRLSRKSKSNYLDDLLLKLTTVEQIDETKEMADPELKYDNDYSDITNNDVLDNDLYDKWVQYIRMRINRKYLNEFDKILNDKNIKMFTFWMNDICNKSILQSNNVSLLRFVLICVFMYTGILSDNIF